MTPWFTNSQFMCYKSNKNYTIIHKIHYQQTITKTRRSNPTPNCYKHHINSGTLGATFSQWSLRLTYPYLHSFVWALAPTSAMHSRVCAPQTDGYCSKGSLYAVKPFVHRNLQQYADGGVKRKYCITETFCPHILMGTR